MAALFVKPTGLDIILPRVLIGFVNYTYVFTYLSMTPYQLQHINESVRNVVLYAI